MVNMALLKNLAQITKHKYNTQQNDKRICDYIDGLLSPSEVNKLENEVLNLENRELRKKFDDLHRATETIVGKSNPLPATIRLGIKRMQEAHNKFCNSIQLTLFHKFNGKFIYWNDEVCSQ